MYPIVCKFELVNGKYKFEIPKRDCIVFMNIESKIPYDSLKIGQYSLKNNCTVYENNYNPDPPKDSLNFQMIDLSTSIGRFDLNFCAPFELVIETKEKVPEIILYYKKFRIERSLDHYINIPIFYWVFDKKGYCERYIIVSLDTYNGNVSCDRYINEYEYEELLRDHKNEIEIKGGYSNEKESCCCQ